MKKLISLLLLATTSIMAFQTTYDINLSPYSGSDNILGVHNTIGFVDDYFLKEYQQKSDSLGKNILMSFERLFELSLIWHPLNSYLTALQHEYFGHGYRLRDLGANKISDITYKINLPPPYGHGGGYTKYLISELTPFDDLATTIAGVEATSILSSQIREKWLLNGKINPFEISLYLGSFHDLTDYILSTKDKESSGDIACYVRALENLYPNSYPSITQLQTLSAINLLDPFTYFAIYGWFKYIFTGKETTLPMINIKNSKYLIAPKLGLSLFGPEVYLENYLIHNETLYSFYYKQGHFWKNKYFGIGFYSPNIVKGDNYSSGIKIDLWLQPDILKTNDAMYLYEDVFFYGFDEDMLRKKIPGYSISYLNSYQFENISSLFLNFEIGYKSKGFLPGRSLKNSPIVKIGLSGTF